MFTTFPVPMELPMFSVMKCLRQWKEQADITHSISRADSLFAPSQQRAGDGAPQWSRVFCSILGACFNFARASNLVSGESWSTVRLEQRACGEFLCLLRSSWSLRWHDVCICTDASEKCIAFTVGEGCRELASEVERVSERTRFRSISMSIGARSRALRSIAPDAV